MSGFFKAWLMLLQTTSDLGEVFFFRRTKGFAYVEFAKAQVGKAARQGIFFWGRKKGRILEGQILTLEMVRKKEFQVLN